MHMLYSLNFIADNKLRIIVGDFETIRLVYTKVCVGNYVKYIGCYALNGIETDIETGQPIL